MNVKGVGTDIIEIERIRQAIAEHGESFIQRIFTPAEQEYCKKHRDPLPQYAARFSAKESVAKALGCGIGSQVGFLDIEISHDSVGKPEVIFSAEVQARLSNPRILLSMSHCKQYATTIAILLVQNSEKGSM